MGEFSPVMWLVLIVLISIVNVAGYTRYEGD